jgi:hypothetical protein
LINPPVDARVRSPEREAELKVEIARRWVDISKERVSLFKHGSFVGLAGAICGLLSLLSCIFLPSNIISLLPLVVFLGLMSFQIAQTQIHIIHVLDEIKRIIEIQHD